MPDATRGFQIARITTYVEVTDERRVEIQGGLTVVLRQVNLTDYPNGTKSVSAYGNLVRKDNLASRLSRTASWDEGTPVPEEIAAIVAVARPGWWKA